MRHCLLLVRIICHQCFFTVRKQIMTRRILIPIAAFLFSLSLTGCIHEMPQNEPTKGAQLSQTLPLLGFADTEFGCFYMNDDILCRLDDSGNALVPLCQKPGCTHDGANCDAYYPQVRTGIGCFRGSLYLAAEQEDRFVVFRTDPNTGQREEILRLPEVEYSVRPDVVSLNAYFHENKMIALQRAGYENLQSAPEDAQKQHVFVAGLDSLKISEPFTEFLDRHYNDSYAMVSSSVCADGDILFFRGEEPFNSSMGDTAVSNHLLRADLNTGNIERVFENQEMEATTWCCREDKLCFVEQNGDFIEYDLKTGERVRKPCPAADAFSAYYYDNLIVLKCYPDLRLTAEEMAEGYNPFDKIEYTFFSEGYETLDSLSVTNGLNLAFVTKDRLYFKHPDHPDLFYLDRAAIGSGNLELKPMPMGNNET